MWTRVELKEKAKLALKQNYWKVVLACVILALVGGDSAITFEYETSTTGANPEAMFAQGYSMLTAIGLGVLSVAIVVGVVVGLVVGAFLCNPVILGVKKVLVDSLKGPSDLSNLVYGFNSNYKNVVKVMFFRDISVILWSLLLIVPGVIKACEYFMVDYLLTENPNLSKEDAFEISKRMMDGHKWDTFVLQLSFIGWEFLSVFTLGILNAFYVSPYKNLTLAALYENLNAANGYPAGGSTYRSNYTYEQAGTYYTNDEI